MKYEDLSQTEKGRIIVELNTYQYTTFEGGPIRNGSIIEKCNSEKGDYCADGARGIVLGSLPEYNGEHFYFVEWENLPTVPVGVVGKKIKAIKSKGEEQWLSGMTSNS